jgi:hypothetical protein
MGFNRNMPRSVVFAPKVYQGLGMKHLYDLQGCDSTRLLLQELNAEDSPTSRMTRAVLEIIQLESGIGKPILEDTRSLDFIKWGWIPQIREFLQHIDAKITGATKTPPTYRKHDQYIMDSEILSTMTYKEQMLTHRCRLFLQVELLSDISDAAGERILPEWLGPDPAKSSKSTNIGQNKVTRERRHGRYGETSSSDPSSIKMANSEKLSDIGPNRTSLGYIKAIVLKTRKSYTHNRIRQGLGELMPEDAPVVAA